jgi:transcriptional regulator with XRE-family HTH domain
MATLKVPDRVGDLGGYLKEQRESARLSLRQLASVAGVSNPYLSQIERGLRKPSAEVLQQIAKGLQISAEALFLRAGLLEASGGIEVEVAIQSELHLTARQKRVLLDIYSTFRAENARALAESSAAEVAAEVVASELAAERAERAGASEEPGHTDEIAARRGRSAKVVPLKSAESLKSAGPDADADAGSNRRRAAGSTRSRTAGKRATAKRATKTTRTPRKAT